MKKLIFTLVVSTIVSVKSFGQFVFNPQVGITAQTAINNIENEDYKARVGYTLGADGRIGSRFYFQPVYIIQLLLPSTNMKMELIPQIMIIKPTFNVKR
jgi:hypothetical protein